MLNVPLWSQKIRYLGQELCLVTMLPWMNSVVAIKKTAIRHRSVDWIFQNILILMSRGGNCIMRPERRHDESAPSECCSLFTNGAQSQAFARWHWQCLKNVRQMGRHSKSAILTNHSQEFCFPRIIINKGKQKAHVRLQIFSVVSLLQAVFKWLKWIGDFYVCNRSRSLRSL